MAYHPAHNTYFENQVLTASPQKLRWMAIDGAIRFARQAGEHWRQQRIYEGGESAIGCQRLLVELMSTLRPEQAPEIVARVGGLYAYVSRLLNDARRGRDQKKLSEVIEILEIERETWRLVCEQLHENADDKGGGVSLPRAEAIGDQVAAAAQHLASQPAVPPPIAPRSFRRFEADPPAASGFTASA